MNKKNLVFTCALAVTLFTSCNNEVDTLKPTSTAQATIELNISNDNDLMVTRASTTVTDMANWKIKVGSGSAISVSDLPNKTYTAGQYNIKVSNYADLAAAMPKNGAGNAYFEGTKQVTLQKGANTVEIDCSKAKNAKLTVNTAGTKDVPTITDMTINATQSDKRNYTFSQDGSAFFYAAEVISYTISYKYNGTLKTISNSIPTVAAATEYQLIVSTNTNGKITLTVKCDNEFTQGGNTQVNIDAATGDKATNN